MTLVDVAEVFIGKDEPPKQVAEHLRTVAASIPKTMPSAADMEEPTAQDVLVFFK